MGAVVYMAIGHAGFMIGLRQVELRCAGQMGVKLVGQPAEAAITGLEVAGRVCGCQEHGGGDPK